jgi:glycosyltransferase involved in cell wall biosynthesis
MKRILFLSPNLGLNGGGAERQIVNVACGLKQKGYFVEFLCYCEGDFYEDNLKKNDIIVYRKLLSNYIKRLFYVRQFIRKNKYDVVISFLETPNFLNCFSAIGGRNWKVIIGERSANDNFLRSRKGKIFCWFHRFADYIVCNSENAKIKRERYFPAYKDKLKVIYNKINIDNIASEYTPKRDGKTNIVILASYQYLKNPIGMVKAILSMNKDEREGLDISWYGNKNVFKGNTSCYDEVIKLVKDNNLEDTIHFNLQTDNPYEKINGSDFVALFSKYEGLPNAICEGMIMGKPIIMSKVSDYDVLVDGTNGFLFDCNDEISIKNAIVKAKNMTEEEIIDMGLNSKNKANNLFSENVIIEKWISLIQ